MADDDGGTAEATLDWYGCATFRLTVGELVVFLDAYIDRFPGAPGPDVRTDDIDRADWIVIGHSHFDHLWGAERIARRTGATIIGSHETIRIMEREGVPDDQLLPVSGGERIRLSADVTVAVYPSLHSSVWTHQFPASDEACLGDLWLTYQERQVRQAERPPATGLAGLSPQMLAHFQLSNQHPRGDGGALLYLFETSQGRLLFQDTSGHWSGILRDLRPDVAILAATGRPTIDGEPIQGSLADFIARQAQLLHPARVILSHHDDFLPGRTIPADIGPIRAALARAAPRTELIELTYTSGYPPFAKS
ncbi:MBL fold metallo-hydrolase [Actinoallomurus iriomotensis]|uniref:MBL fold metallo-hydrolase n=1 Tax=Actinoallomurus iriomotensis TaxID=478107 RepID=A0A9W6RGE5_9ACTN|nr:MBL fold metallo-hydrolase [Actinoallomurus iriomotensis]GLY73592.1 MBL fold metallo-hydrolase [Actinoallomurus iriomotensis]